MAHHSIVYIITQLDLIFIFECRVFNLEQITDDEFVK